jgi:hypothetical protein
VKRPLAYRLFEIDLLTDGPPQIDEKSCFTREFLWWLAGEGSGSPRGRPDVQVMAESETKEYRVRVQIRFEDELAASEFALTYETLDWRGRREIVMSVFDWTDINGEPVLTP